MTLTCTQVVILGSAPNPDVAQQFKELQASTAQDGDVRIVLAFDEGKASNDCAIHARPLQSPGLEAKDGGSQVLSSSLSPLC
jgi:hypothetical protein